MKYKEIEDIFSAKRMQKYVLACGGDTLRAMTLYQFLVVPEAIQTIRCYFL